MNALRHLNATGATMPSVGNPDVQLQNMAQVSCSTAPGTQYWVATIGNNCNAPACFTSAGVACAPGSQGCPCTVVTACTPQVATAPVPCLYCPPTPCVVCPPPPLSPLSPGAANTNNSAAVASATSAVSAARALIGRRLTIFSGGGGGGSYTPSRSYNSNNNHGAGSAPGVAPPAMQCVSAACLSCQSKQQATLLPIAFAILLAFYLFAGYLRQRLHNAYHIEKDGCCGVEDSFLPWLCCSQCALCQEARTIDQMEREMALVHGIHDPQAAPLIAPPLKQM